MILAHLALFSFLEGASVVPAPVGGVESAAPVGIFVWFDGASGVEGPDPAPIAYYKPTFRPRRRQRGD